MIARKYNKQIELWTTFTVEDGYGGSTIEDDSEYILWANVVTKRASRSNDVGQNFNTVQTVFTIRNRYDISISIKDNYIKYNDIIYNIDSVLNLDLDNIDIEIYASQRM